MRQKTFGKWLTASRNSDGDDDMDGSSCTGCADGEFYKDHLKDKMKIPA